MIIGFTGSRNGLTKKQQRFLSRYFCEHATNLTVLHHGCCIGADKCAHEEFRRVTFGKIIGHPPKYTKYIGIDVSECDYFRQPKEYLKRNHNIVDECDFLIACPKEKKEILRSGTWATVRYAIKTGKPYLIIPGDE